MIDGFKVFGFQIDVARQIERPEVIRRAVTGMHEHGYNLCMLYLEDAYQYPRHPEIARRNAYSVDVMRELAALCRGQGMELVPVIPTLGYCSWITSKKHWGHLDEARGTGHNFGSIDPTLEETYALLGELLEDWCRHVPGTYLHVGLDESPYLGKFRERTTGTKADVNALFTAHCNRVNAMCRSLGRRMVMWGDMFYYMSAAMDRVDKDIVVADWYYYAFPNRPRVEAFGFSDIDLSGDLKRRGFEVWGVPSVWPNSPYPDVKDRWQALNDWVRYGRQVGIDGIVISDWENSTGFYSASSDVSYRAFGSGLLKATPEPIERQVGETLRQLTGVDCASIIDDMMKLGAFALTGHANRRLVFRSPASRANAYRQAECQANSDSLATLLTGINDLETRAVGETAKDTLRGIRLSKRFMEMVWKVGAVLPGCYEDLCAGRNLDRAARIFRDLAQEVEAFHNQYRSLWNRVRYADDRQVVGEWAETMVADLRGWADAIDQGRIKDHPWALVPRIECIQHCRRPALPVALYTAIWNDGTCEVAGETMINFHSRFARPAATWRQCPSIPLGRAELPRTIKVEANNFGEVGFEDLAVVWKGKRHAYRLVKTQGNHVRTEGKILWLGPVAATLESPLIRPERDEAWFEKEG